jgi:aryl-alcohol dehydrogenase-like predicted oxidoreductase
MRVKMKIIDSKLGKISAIGFGCFQSTDKKVIDTAINDGVNFFVTAETYGDENQKALGEALGNIKEKVFIATKVGVNLFGKNPEEQFLQSREQIRESVKKSVTLLGKTPLDLVGLHRLDDVHHGVNEYGELVPAWEIALDELINLQKSGLINHIGLSEPTAEQIERAVLISKSKGSSIAAIESAYSIVTRRAEINGVKKVCDRNEITFIAYSSIAHGLTDLRLKKITDEDFKLSNEEFRKKVFYLLEMENNFILENVDMFSSENIKHNVKFMLMFQDFASKYNITPTQLSLAWVQHKGAIPIPGTRKAERVNENNASNLMLDILESKGVFAELDQLFPANTFLGDPNPLAIAGALDANSKKLNQKEVIIDKLDKLPEADIQLRYDINNQYSFFYHKKQQLKLGQQHAIESRQEPF